MKEVKTPLHLIHSARCVRGICPHNWHQHAYHITSRRCTHSVVATRSAAHRLHQNAIGKITSQSRSTQSCSSVRHSFSDAPAINRCRIPRIRQMNLISLTTSSRLSTGSSYARSKTSESTRTCWIHRRILQISLIRTIDPIIPCHLRRQGVSPDSPSRAATGLAGVPRANGNNSPFRPQVGSIDWGVMSQPQQSQPILPTVVGPSPPAILETEDNDEELELPHLEQQETTHSAQSSPSKKQKTGKKKKPGENQDSPGSSPRNEPAASSNLNPNNPFNLPMQSGSEEDFIPHAPTSSGTGSPQRTIQYSDQEDGESEDF